MSKLTKLTDAIQKLDEAEQAVLNLRRAFDKTIEFSVLIEQANDISNIRDSIERMLRKVEAEAMAVSGVKSPQI